MSNRLCIKCVQYGREIVQCAVLYHLWQDVEHGGGQQNTATETQEEGGQQDLRERLGVIQEEYGIERVFFNK